MKKYNLINNALGWGVFVIAALTYLLTVEPTASFWDCPEFIAQGFKLEVGHPPGNPIFMLTARFFVTLFGGSATSAALAVNCMSALLSAATILLLFWTITHLVRRLIVRDDAEQVSWFRMVAIMGSGLCGAMAYAWSDTFWFSAVEGEVYAFSSFCTALVFWLILKWENRADQPHSDRYLVLIAYVLGISIAVHLLNLLCIPAIVLVFYYKKVKHATVKGSLLALALSGVIVFFILYGLVPGFIAVAQRFELFCVNVLGMGYNMGVLVYALITLAVFVWTVYELYRQRSARLIKTGVFASIILSGMPFVGHSALIPVILIIALAVYLFGFCRKIPVRIFNVLILSVMVIFIGYSSYALLLIRASADTPMNQNSPDNVFALASYLNREQYGDRPLFYGPTVVEELSKVSLGQDPQTGADIMGVEVDANGYPSVRPVRGVQYDYAAPIDNGSDNYVKVVKASPDEPDRYVAESHRPDYQYSSDMMMLLPRMYSPDERAVRNYKSWSEYQNGDFANIPAEVRRKWAQQGYVTLEELNPYLHNLRTIDMGTLSDGSPYITQGWKMGVLDNLRFFLNYQLNHMYWRYFMWNFAGRQNDIQGNGEPNVGNWISGIPVIDNLRLGDQSLLPDEFGSGNAGHNVFYMLPLLLGLIGLLWQALYNGHTNGNRGIEQFWVVFFLFFMTGIAIVLYLNQTAPQPRERDYAFAGSFYAFAIWIGMGVAAIAVLLRNIFEKALKNEKTAKIAATAVACIAAVGVPLQMVSQTWDDHDRSGRYTTRDFGMNYLNSLDENAIIFTNGDNDTFPLWYAQEVEGCRTDVKVVNLSYLSTDWYARQITRPSYEALPIPTYAQPLDYAYDKFWATRMSDPSDSLAQLPVTADVALPAFYNGTSPALKRMKEKYMMSDDEAHLLLADANIYVPLDSARIREVFGKYPSTADSLHHGAYFDLKVGSVPRSAGLSNMLTFDIIARQASDGWKRPVYFATTVPSSYAMGFEKNLQTVGLAQQVTPFENPALEKLAQKGYVNIVTRWRWGGLSANRKIYLDETVRRMVSSVRLGVLAVVTDLLQNPNNAADKAAKEASAKAKLPAPRTQLDMARNLLTLMAREMPRANAPYESMMDLQLAETYLNLWAKSGNKSDLANAEQLIDACITRYGQLNRYAASLGAGARSRLGSAERQALSYAYIAIGFRNYVNLRKAMLAKEHTAEELKMLDHTMSLNRGYETYNWTYLMNATDAELQDMANLDDYYYAAAASALYLRELHARYNIPVMGVTDAAAKRLGLPLEQWQLTVR